MSCNCRFFRLHSKHVGVRAIIPDETASVSENVVRPTPSLLPFKCEWHPTGDKAKKAAGMDLVLWRHAEAHEWTQGCDDMARPLTARGERQAARMATWLDRQLPENTRIFASPACRAEQTASALDRKFKVRPGLGPMCGVSDLLELVQWPDAKGTLLVVGHQPTLGQVIAQLIGLKLAECPVRKGSVWWLRNRQRETFSQTVVVAVQSPELL